MNMSFTYVGVKCIITVWLCASILCGTAAFARDYTGSWSWPDGWSSPEIVSSDQLGSLYPEMVEDIYGNYHLFFTMAMAIAPNVICHSSWDGAQWSTPETIYTLPEPCLRHLAVDVDANNVFHMAVTVYKDIYYGRWDGETMLEFKWLISSGNKADIAVRRSDGAVFVYCSGCDFWGGSMRQRQNGEWGEKISPQYIGHADGNGPCVMVDRQGLAHLAIGSYATTGPLYSYLNYFIYDNETQVSVLNIPITEGGHIDCAVDMDLDTNDIAHFAVNPMQYGTLKNIYYLRSDGTTYSYPTLLSVLDTTCLHISLGVDLFNRIHVAWTANNWYSYGDLAYRCNIGGQWLAIDDFTCTHNQGITELLTDRSGLTHLFWQEQIPGDEMNHYFICTTRREMTTAGLNLIADKPVYHGGETLSLTRLLANPAGETTTVDFYWALEADGHYYFAPEWDDVPTPVRMQLPTGARETTEMLSVTLPADLPPGGPYTFYGVLCMPDTYDLIGSVATARFRF